MGSNKETVSSTDFQKHIAKFLDDVLRGKTILITRWGRPIAALQPVAPEDEERKDET